MKVLRLIPRILGVLLLSAAALKAQGMSVAPVSAMGWFSAAWFQVSLVLAEVALGLWLLSGVTPLGSWMLALATFTVFAGFSFYQGWTRQPSCGCFGRLSVSPWYAFGLDIVVLACLALGRPDLKLAWQNPRHVLRPSVLSVAWGAAGVAILTGIFVGSAHFAFGSVPAAIAYFRGERVSVDPGVVDIGAGLAGEEQEVSIALTNWTDQPIQVLGGTSDCSCTVLGGLPVRISPKESVSLQVVVGLKGSPGVFTRKAAFLIDDNGLKRIAFSITGQVRAPVTENP